MQVEISHLTKNSIYKLFNGEQCPDELIIQIISISQNYRNQQTCMLSDGFTKVKGLLVEHAKEKVEKDELMIYEVVSIKKENIIIMSPQKQPSFELKDCKNLNIRLVGNIGVPIPYAQFIANNYQNSRGSTQIMNGLRSQSLVTIAELIERSGRGSWALKAKVINIPPILNKSKQFLIVNLLDKNGQVIEAVTFGKNAQNLHNKLRVNHQYLFSNALLQKSRFGSKYELKFGQQTKIIPLTLLQQSTIQPQKPTQKVSKPIQQKKQQQFFKFKQIQQRQFFPNNFSIAAKVVQIKKIKNGQSVNLIDENRDGMQAVIWQQCSHPLQLGKIYIFRNLNIRRYHKKVNLTSVRGKTVIESTNLQFPETQNKSTTKYSQGNNNGQSMPKQKKYIRQLTSTDSLLNVTEVMREDVREPTYKNVFGYLMIKTQYMEKKNFFMNRCKQCDFKQINVAPLTCAKCSSSRVSVKLNIRASLIDEHKDQIRCGINEQLSIKLLKWDSETALQKLVNHPQQFKKKVNEINFQEYIFKVKLNPSGNNIYYNLLDIYHKDSQLLMEKVKKELIKVRKQFEQFKTIVNVKENMNTNMNY